MLTLLLTIIKNIHFINDASTAHKYCFHFNNVEFHIAFCYAHRLDKTKHTYPTLIPPPIQVEHRYFECHYRTTTSGI